ncbi:MAG: flagellar biosynthetic protein FliQ [Candidatus Omnitrophica bacterium]|nr:flagellar biosynthetic protein FliQ [Candidatus Omnitrophota bacterium]
MTIQMTIDIGQLALITFLKVAGPMLAAGMIVGITVSLFQSMTQIQEITLTFIPKIIAVLLTTVLFLPWIVSTLTQFTHEMLLVIPGAIKM